MGKHPTHAAHGAKATQITIRVGGHILREMDELVSYVSRAHGKPSTRADVHRDALLLGIAVLQQRAER